jgi:hypothetical protein
VRDEQGVAIPDTSRSAHAVPVGHDLERERELPELLGETTVGVFDEHRAGVVSTVVGEATPPVATPSQTPHQAARWLVERVEDRQAPFRRIEDADVALVRHGRIIRMSRIDASVMKKTAVEMLRIG